MPVPRYYRLSVSTGTNCPHDISPSLESYVRTSLPRSMSPWHDRGRLARTYASRDGDMSWWIMAYCTSIEYDTGICNTARGISQDIPLCPRNNDLFPPDHLNCHVSSDARRQTSDGSRSSGSRSGIRSSGSRSSGSRLPQVPGHLTKLTDLWEV